MVLWSPVASGEASIVDSVGKLETPTVWSDAKTAMWLPYNVSNVSIWMHDVPNYPKSFRRTADKEAGNGSPRASRACEYCI